MMESVLFSFPVKVQMPSNACCKLLSMACGMIFCDRVFWHSNENRQPDSGAVVHRQVLLGTSYWTTHWLRTTKGQFSCRYLTGKLSAAASLDPEQKLPNSGKTPHRYFQSTICSSEWEEDVPMISLQSEFLHFLSERLWNEMKHIYSSLLYYQKILST